jgi:hypothetical protein
MHDVEEEARIKRILEVLDRTLQLSLKIDEVVGRLSEKRVTLEEKMIRSYFHQIAANLLGVCALLHRSLALATTPRGVESVEGADIGQEVNISRQVNIADSATISAACQPFNDFLDRLESNVDELLKALRYNLNYVEQYFEFNYYGKLTNEDKFLEDAELILSRMTTALS